jgi:hypothetical protein
VQLSRSGLSSKFRRDLGFGRHDPQARSFCDMLSPALRPEHALLLTFPSTGRLPSDISAADFSRLCSMLQRCRSIAEEALHAYAEDRLGLLGDETEAGVSNP